MARKVSHTLVIDGILVAETPLHVGGAEAGMTSDMPLAVDGRGRYYLPGTSLGGAIRAYCRAGERDEVWGFAAGNDQGTASRIVIDDAQAEGAPLAELWHGNGIDRRWGAAADGIKYDREVLPRGTAFAFRLTLEVLKTESVAERRAFLSWLIATLEAGRIAVGAASTRGLGRVRLTQTRALERDWSTPAGILAWLGPDADRDHRDEWDQTARYSPDASHPSVRIEIQWRPTGPLMSKSARDGMVVDGLPFLSRLADGSLALTLPGSGTKGAWRSHAERIVRTVTGQDGTLDGPHHEQVDCSLAADLFGRARPTDPAPGKAAITGRRKGRLAFETCYARFALPPEQWDDLERGEDPWRNPPSAACPLSMAMHVAVDRWTGGAAEALLYSAVEPGRIEWEPLVLHFDASCDPLAEFALLWLTLRDFCAGRIPLGFGVNRGYGDLQVERIALSGLQSLGADQDEAVLTVTDRFIDEAPVEGLLDDAKVAWQHWLATQTEAA